MKFAPLAAAALAAATLIPTTPAHAVTGCEGKVRTQMSSRAEDTYFVEPITANKVPLRVTASLIYWYCPNGPSAWKVSTRWAEFCWIQPGKEDNHRLFDGVTFNMRVINDVGIVANPGKVHVADDGTRQNCRQQSFSDSDMTRWTYGFNDPRWAASFTTNLKGMNDQHHDFGENAGSSDGKKYRRLHTHTDTVLKDWWS